MGTSAEKPSVRRGRVVVAPRYRMHHNASDDWSRRDAGDGGDGHGVCGLVEGCRQGRMITLTNLTAVVMSLTLAGIATGCSTTDQLNEPAQKAGDDSEMEKPRSKIGGSITLKGTDTTIETKLLRVDRDVEVGELDQPEEGRKYVGIRIRLTNVGEGTYEDAPHNGAKLITTRGEGERAIVTGGECGGGFADGATISPVSSGEGCLPFEIKENAKPKTFQFSLPDSGKAGQESGEWSLR